MDRITQEAYYRQRVLKYAARARGNGRRQSRYRHKPQDRAQVEAVDMTARSEVAEETEAADAACTRP